MGLTRATSNDGPIEAQVGPLIRFCSRMTIRLPLVLTPADTPYTAIVRGVDETVGVALVEVYDFD